jgi:TonB family protein
MDKAKRQLWKFIGASAGLHFVIGGLLFFLPLKLFQPHPSASVMQVSLVNAVEATPVATKAPEMVETSLQVPSDLPVHDTDVVKETDEAVVQPSSRGSDTLAVAEISREAMTGDGSRPEELSRFLQDVRIRLDRAKQYPWTARLRGQEGTVRIQFRIAPSGEVKNVHLMESSGAKILDDEAIATLERVGRFSEPPVSWNAGVSIQVPLVFQLNSP